MPRIPYLPVDLAEPRELVASIRARRGGRLMNLDRLLLHSPAFAEGWNAHLRAVRTSLSLDPKLRELAICVVAVANGADYEFHHHAPAFRAAGGTAEQLATLRDVATLGAEPSPFSPAERAVIALTLELTRDVRVSDATFDRVRAALSSDQQTVELIGVVATYNMVSRFLVALEVEPES